MESKIQIHNTMSRKKEDFIPVKAGQVGLYLCGPTVYDFLHIGNYRGVIFFNSVRNWLEYRGYKVNYVYNYTDVDDKIIKRSQEQGTAPEKLTEHFIAEFEKDFKLLGLTPHTHNPRVTHYIPQIIRLIEQLIENKKAYVVNGEVLYSVQSFEGYGKLSGKSIDDLISGARVEIGLQKQNPLDFSLWKPAKPGEPKWPSPWGEGRPGWHIECSAMASSLLGNQIDIHGGGIDLIFPHHENEIAQSEGSLPQTGSLHTHPFVKYWMHNNFINFGAHKMSKSLGNVMVGRKFIEEFGGEILKYMILLAHYRSPVDFSQDQIDHAVHGLARIYSALHRVNQVMKFDPLSSAKVEEMGSEGQGLVTPDGIAAWKGICSAMDDDFNTPEVFARVFEFTRKINGLFKPNGTVVPGSEKLFQDFWNVTRNAGKILALFQEEPAQYLVRMDDLLLKKKNLDRTSIQKLVEERAQSRRDKNFSRSDELRGQLTQMGIAIQDGPEGSSWEVQK